jgi:amidase
MRDDYRFATALEVAAAIRSREVSPVEVLDATLARIEALNDQLVAIVWRNDDEARKAAQAAADAVVHRDPGELSPFHGVPIPIKDLTAVAGWPVTYGSWGATGTPSEESELIVEAFRRAGFILTGRTNTPEFGPITATENDRYGISRNPWNLDRTPGGSSGGAGAAVAAGLFPVAHATDGGGSIRIPASCCGLVGLKVSRGRVPSLVRGWEGGSVHGVVTRDVADTAAILDVTSAPDRGQWYNAPAPDRPYLSEVGADPGRLRIGMVEVPPFELPIDDACLTAVEAAAFALEGLGHTVRTASLEIDEAFLRAFMKVVNAGLADYDVDWDRVEPHNRVSRTIAQSVDSLSYVGAVHVLQRLSRPLVARWGEEFDVLLSPTMTIEPPRAGEILAAVHAGAETGTTALQVFQMAALTSAWNMTGQPAISLPTHQTADGIPIGVQLVGGPWEEARLLRLASQVETSIPWADRRPAL